VEHAAQAFAGPPDQVADGAGATAVGVVTVQVTYGFVNVQNLAPSMVQAFTRGSTVALRWTYTDVTGTAVASVTADPEVVVTPVKVKGLPAGWTGRYTVSSPGPGSFVLPAPANGNTWQFNWRTAYTDPATGVLADLPAGTYQVVLKSRLTKQVDPVVAGTAGVQIVIR